MSKIILKYANTLIFSELLGKKIDKVSPINSGVMNYVYKAYAQDGSIYYLKQALTQAKGKTKLSEDLASVSENRLECESKSIVILKNYLHTKSFFTLPKIHSFNKISNILITHDLNNHGTLQRDLEKGVFNKKLARNIGKYLAYQHSKTFNKDVVVRKNAKEEMKHWRFFLSLRTKKLSKNRVLSGFKKEITEVYKNGILNTSKLLVHMDFCPKNILYSSKECIAIVDFEFSSGFGDPAYDLGFVIGHYILFALISGQRDKVIRSAFEIYDHYFRNTRNLPFQNNNIEQRTWKYAGCTLLYRVIGASPMYYIKSRYKNRIIDIGKQLLKQDFINKEVVQQLVK